MNCLSQVCALKRTYPYIGYSNVTRQFWKFIWKQEPFSIPYSKKRRTTLLPNSTWPDKEFRRQVFPRLSALVCHPAMLFLSAQKTRRKAYWNGPAFLATLLSLWPAGQCFIHPAAGTGTYKLADDYSHLFMMIHFLPVKVSKKDCNISVTWKEKTKILQFIKISDVKEQFAHSTQEKKSAMLSWKGIPDGSALTLLKYLHWFCDLQESRQFSLPPAAITVSTCINRLLMPQAANPYTTTKSIHYRNDIFHFSSCKPRFGTIPFSTRINAVYFTALRRAFIDTDSIVRHSYFAAVL